ncbi:MAG: helix-turn-helix domain-containing protein [Lentisphaerae bacterium]|nr:helix-turn-helix domain-containing protein [Lentisphaerota bacterium]
MPFTSKQKIDNAVFNELQQHLQDLSESFQIHCCWKATAALKLEFRLNTYVAKHSCSFCARYKQVPAQEKKCIAHDNCTLTALLAGHQDAFEARCPAGAWELIVPFHQHGICLGAVLCGPYRKSEDPPDELLTELNAFRLQSLTNIIRQLLQNSITQAYADRMQQTADPRIAQALNFIRKNFCRKLTAGEVAGKIGLSRSRFLHLFPQECGRTFGDYLRELRIAEGCRLLRQSNTPIDQIAYTLGFCTQSHFNSVFIKQIKMTPRQYRLQALRQTP